MSPRVDADIAALTVLKAVLATGESSRLYESVVYRDQLCSPAEAFLDTKQATGNLVVCASAGGKTAGGGGSSAEARDVVPRMSVTTADIAVSMKNEILTQSIESRETAEGKASTLWPSKDRWRSAGGRQAAAAIAQSVPRIVQRVARKYVTATINRYDPVCPSATSPLARSPIRSRWRRPCGLLNDGAGQCRGSP
jgi:zinc protease